MKTLLLTSLSICVMVVIILVAGTSHLARTHADITNARATKCAQLIVDGHVEYIKSKGAHYCVPSGMVRLD